MVQVSGDGPWQHRDTLRVGNTYYLRVLGDSLMGEGISWIYEPDGDEGPQNPDRNTPRPKFSVRRPGSYIVKVFRGQREIVRDTLVVIEGDRIEVQWPAEQAEVGVPISATDRSTGAKGRRWYVWEGGQQMVDASTVEQLTYTPTVQGELIISMTVAMPAGDTTLQHAVQVARALPKKVLSEKRGKKEESLRPPILAPQRRDPPPAASTPVERNDCFGARTAFIPKVPNVVLVPMPQAPEGSADNTETIIEVTPERDCQLVSFQWWAERKGDAVVVFECLAPLCKGPKERKFGFSFVRDLRDPQQKDFANTPILRAGERYRIRVKAEPGMGMVGRSDMYDEGGIGLRFPQEKSSVFRLTFRVQ